jgi:hypothetical protein
MIKKQFTLRALFFAMTATAVVLSVIVTATRKTMTVRPPTAQREYTLASYGLAHVPSPLDGMSLCLESRRVFDVSTRFSKSTRLRATLYLVESGKSTVLTLWDIVRSEARLAPIGPFGENTTIVFVFGETTMQEGRVTVLGCAGASRAAATFSPRPHRVQNVQQALRDGDFRPGREHLVYVDGEREPVTRPGMTIEEFAADNSGSFLVVGLRLYE